jgi:hypothetical protein
MTKDTHSTPLSQAQGRSGQAAERKGDNPSQTYANRQKNAEVYANLGCLGMHPSETYANLGYPGGGGGGMEIAKIAIIG